MGTVLPYFKEAVFPPATLQLLGEAFDSVCKELHDRGQPEVVREIIAKKIVELATRGEREPQRIAALVLEEMGITQR